jgi:hypothetical protein
LAFRILILLLWFASIVAAQNAAPVAGSARFVVLIRGTQVGTAGSVVTRTSSGWTIEGTGRIDAPLALDVRRLDVEYTDDWRPRGATLDMATGAEGVVVHAGFVAGSDAKVDIVRDGRQVVFVTVRVSGDAVILPNLAFGAYEALAARLTAARAGNMLRAYVLPEREVAIRLDSVTDETLRGTDGPLPTKRWHVTFLDPAGEIAADVWIRDGRLVRFDLPAQALSVVRDDVARP